MYYPPQPQRPHRSGVPGGVVALIAGAFLGLGLIGGCVAGIGIASAPAEPAAAAAPSSTGAAGETTSAAPAPSASSAEPSSSSPSPSPVRRIKVPDVVGMNHQEAQDLLQSRGLYMLQEEDATGQHRLLLWDRNWVVVRQDPKAGSRVREDETITLYSKKIGE